MKSYIVTIQGMAKHITSSCGETTFTELSKARAHFLEFADFLGLDNIEVLANGNLEAGGIGYDHRISLEITEI